MRQLLSFGVVKQRLLVLPLAVAVFIFAILPAMAFAQPSNEEGFSLQVTPSPLVATVKPGTTTMLDMSIRNTNTTAQKLKMGLRTFKVDETSGQVSLGSTEPTDVKDLVTFSNPTFTVDAGAIFTQKISFATPANAGFTYSFAITISRDDVNLPQTSTGAKIKGSVAVFTLLNVDRPGSQRKFVLGEFSASKHLYEFLPASFSIKLKNTGNTLVQPKGNLYIQRGSNDQTPLMVLPLNGSGGFILPGTNRVFTAEWKDGFPHYETTTSETGQTHKQLVWDWGSLSKLRIGRYTAKVVAVYDDGQRDVPINSEVTFWVIPWRIILGLVFIGLLIVVGVVTILRKTTQAAKNIKHKTSASKSKHEEADE